MYIDFITTPVGIVEIKASSSGISSVIFSDNQHDAQAVVKNTITDRCKQQLTEYFSGHRKEFDLPLDQQGTAFQQSVWACLLTIPFGQTASYRDIASMLEKPGAVRAVGAANGKNPVSIIVPCHRVIGSDGSLTGYAGGLARKSWLLRHEGIDSVVSNQADLKLIETTI